MKNQQGNFMKINNLGDSVLKETTRRRVELRAIARLATNTLK